MNGIVYMKVASGWWLYQPIVDLIAFNCLAYRSEGLLPPKDHDGFDLWLDYPVKSTGQAIGLPHSVGVEFLKKGEAPKSFRVRIYVGKTDFPDGHMEDGLLGLGALRERQQLNAFCLYIDRINDYIRMRGVTNVDRWPPAANFARVVRNAIVHQGTININSPKSPPVAWNGIRFSHNDFGRNIFGNDLLFGDLILLMIAVEGEVLPNQPNERLGWHNTSA